MSDSEELDDEYTGSTSEYESDGATSTFSDSSSSGSLAVGDIEEDPDEIDPAELTIPVQDLHPRIQYIWSARALVIALILGAISYVINIVLIDGPELLPVGVSVVVFILGVAHAFLNYSIWRYEVREDALYLERGVIVRVRTTVPFVRIQHVDTSRGPIERLLGLSSSVVYTAGSRGADVTIPGLDAEQAEELQHRLKKLAIAAEGETAV